MYPKHPKSPKPGEMRALAALLRAVKGGNRDHIRRAHQSAWATETPRAHA